MKAKYKIKLWPIAYLIALLTLVPNFSAQAITPGIPAREAPAAQPAVQQMQASELFAIIDEKPSLIALITFTSTKENPNSAACEVEFTDGSRRVVFLPDGAADDLRVRAIKSKIHFVAVPVAVTSDKSAWLIPALIIGGCIVLSGFITRRSLKNNNTVKKIQSQTFKSLRDKKKLTWGDIGGCPEAVAHFKRVARWALRREFYREHGAKIAKGFLLKGPPGTGKTLLAKILCSELDGEGIVVSGSSFVEMFVGVGAARVREIFAPARVYVRKTGKPYIVFIDEIDAVGGKRDEKTNDEKQQTLNALLVEIDGMLADEGIIVIGATNRPEMLDPALLRGGRLEYHIEIGLPDVSGREQILGIHMAGKKIAADATAAVIAKETYGMSGADLAMIINTAATAAADRCIGIYEAAHPEVNEPRPKKGVSPFEIPPPAEDVEDRKEITGFQVVEITHRDIASAVEDLHLGEKLLSRQSNTRQEDKEQTVVHEVGHAVAISVFPFLDKISLVSAERRSKTLGVVVSMPDYERVSRDKKTCLANIVVALAGRCAQMEHYGTEDGGVLGDYRQATDMSRRMVMDWGMSKLGKFGVGKRDDGYQPELSEAFKADIDKTWRALIERCEESAAIIVRKEKARMAVGVKELGEHETIAGRDWRGLMERVPSEVVWTDLPVFKEFRTKRNWRKLLGLS